MAETEVPTTVVEAGFSDEESCGFYDMQFHECKEIISALQPDVNLHNYISEEWCSRPELLTLLNNSVSSTEGPHNLESSISSETSFDNDNSGYNSFSDDRALVDEIMSRPAKCLSHEEKKIRRRELNRLAAQRSRGKKRNLTQSLSDDLAKLTDKNRELKTQLEKLSKEKEILIGAIKKHIRCCSSSMHTPHI